MTFDIGELKACFEKYSQIMGTKIVKKVIKYIGVNPEGNLLGLINKGMKKETENQAFNDQVYQ
jgi:hypothetical protein